MRPARVALVVLLVLVGCDGDGNGSAVGSYTGIWNLVYNLSLDDCGIVGENVPGFIDQHTIEQDDVGITLSAESGLVADARAGVEKDGSFLAREALSGDLLGDGGSCDLITEISYRPLQDGGGDSAESLFVQRVSCNNGFACESRALGRADRQG